jgi:type I restriction enzyme M protein
LIPVTESEAVILYLERLRKEYGYHDDAIKSEVQLPMGLARYKADVVVYSHDKPFAICEAKGPGRTDFDASVDQLSRYMVASGAQLGVVTDGSYDTCFRATKTSAGMVLEPIPDIPRQGLTLEDIGRHTNKELVTPVNIEGLLSSLVDRTVRLERVSSYEAVEQLGKVLLAKVYDERDNAGKPMFRIRYGEDEENVANRIKVILHLAGKQISDTHIDDRPGVSPHTMAILVARLQYYALTSLRDSLTLGALPIERLFMPDPTPFYTPKEVVDFMVELAEPARGEAVLDPACGTGGFLVAAARRGAEVAGKDSNGEAATISRLNLLLGGFDKAEVHAGDALAEITESSRYDVVITDPPFGERLRGPRIADFETAHTPSLSQVIEALFIEKAFRVLKSSGRLCILVPNGMLFNSSTSVVRNFVFRNFTINAIIALPRPSSAQRHESRVPRSVLLLEKKEGPKSADARPVFFAILDSWGKEANEILHEYVRFRKDGVKPSHPRCSIAIVEFGTRLDPEYHVELKIGKERKYPVKPLGSIAQVAIGVKVPDGGQGSKTILVVKGQNIHDMLTEVESAERVSRPDFIPDGLLLRQNDILMTKAGSPGKAGIVTSGGSAVPSENVLLIRTIADVDPHYLLAYLSSDVGRANINGLLSGSVIRSLNLSAIKSLEVPIPPIAVQHRIGLGAKESLRAFQEAREAQRRAYESLSLLSQRVNEALAKGTKE